MTRMTRALSLWGLLVVALLAAPSAMARELPDFTELVKDAAPGVVNISTSRMIERSDSPFRSFGDQQIPEIFRHFFGDRLPMPPGDGQGGRHREERQSLGSGFIIDGEGYIMTNAHVVDGADQILVRLNDRRELEAELVGADEKTDVAVLKVEADDLPTLDLGDSDRLEVGEWVAAIGSPFGFDHSVTSGIVSAINRTLPRDAYVPFIQTDVAINPGNSGGPLFNLDGEVVGINSQIFTRSGGFMGLSFAIPINVAMDVADQLKSSGAVERGWLGVVIQPVSRELAESFGMEGPKGALIADLDPQGPAAEGGLKAGDVILSVDDQPVERSSALPRLIGHVSPGGSVAITVLRDGDQQSLDIEVGEWPDGQKAGGDEREAAPSRLGVSVQSLDDAQRRKLSLDQGVRVTEVDPGGIAAAAGLRPGDVLVSIGREAVQSPAQLAELVAGLPAGSAVPVRLYRDGRSYYVALRLADD
ncbi:DegQ family serine endoprotease [Halomonas borealis]|uniref:DegQ family serine endoprotease n=1 Tax=Halomonas borealis TaxID=2508710 RepID=UPI00109FBCC9|nr:DegQ family serine endoprotease [Halomonas borealis]